jgi:hypothetical protein
MFAMVDLKKVLGNTFCVRLFLQPQEVLKPIGESIVLPPRKETNPFP